MATHPARRTRTIHISQSGAASTNHTHHSGPLGETKVNMNSMAGKKVKKTAPQYQLTQDRLNGAGMTTPASVRRRTNDLAYLPHGREA
jgi:hypothetical protein